MPKLICIVADKTGLRRMLSFALALQGVKTIETENVTEALDVSSKHMVDMFIVDLEVSEPGVLEMVHHLRRTESKVTPPVIIISELDAFEERHLARRLGPVTLLRKPFRISELQRVVANGLESRGLMTASAVEITGAGNANPADATKEGPQA